MSHEIFWIKTSIQKRRPKASSSFQFLNETL